MKTVITDNSLCVFPLKDNARPEHIYKYIQALSEAGVKYVELDYRTIMKMTVLPDEVGYIFRLADPMFSDLAQVFDFNYTLVTLNDLKKPVKAYSPVIVEFPAHTKISEQLLSLARTQINGTIAMVRMRGSYSLTSSESANRMVHSLKNAVTVPVDICPMNAAKTALDCALKFSAAAVDSLTMCMGMSEKYASIEEFVFTLMSVFEVIPKEFNMAAICKAAAYHKLIFSDSCDSIGRIMRLIDSDISSLTNADTGSRVPMRISLKDSQLLHRTFTSALEKMANNENIPDDVFADIYAAVKHYDMEFYNSELLYNPANGLLN